MKRMKAYRYRLYPTKEQEVLLAKHFGCARWVYNYGLNKKIEVYKTEGKTLSYIDINTEITKIKKQEEFSWLKEVNAQSLQASIQNLDKAYTSFFKKKVSFPKFKSKRNKQSAHFPQATKVDFDKNRLFIMKFRDGIKCVFSRTFEGTIKTTTITKTKTGKYYASILVEEDVPEVVFAKIEKETAIGIDLGIKSFLVTSNGLQFENQRFLKKSLDKIKKEQRRLSRKQKDSNNRNKQRLRLALAYEKITNQRNDFLHKVTRQLVNDNQVNTYCLETLNVKGMMKNHCLAQCISDVSWGTFVTYLTYKATWAGKNLLRIGTFEPSSKMCNKCGTIRKDLKLSDRTWTCDCGAVLDRDLNAAINIRDFAFDKQNLLGLGKPEFTLEDI